MNSSKKKLNNRKKKKKKKKLNCKRIWFFKPMPNQP